MKMQEGLMPDSLNERAKLKIEADIGFAIFGAILFEKEIKSFDEIDDLLSNTSDFFHDYYIIENNSDDEKNRVVKKATVTVSSLEEFKYLIEQAHLQTLDSMSKAFVGQIVSLDSVKKKSRDIFEHEKSHAEVAIKLGRKTTYSVFFTKSKNGVLIYTPYVSFGEQGDTFTSVEAEIKYLEGNIEIYMAPKTSSTKLGMSEGDIVNLKEARRRIQELKSGGNRAEGKE